MLDADEAELRRVLAIMCEDSAHHGKPVSQADQELFIAKALEISPIELPRKLEAVRKMAAAAGLDLQTEIKYLLAVPNAARLILAAGGVGFLRAVPALRRTVVKEHAEEVDRHGMAVKGLMGVTEALAALPANGALLPPYTPHPGGRPPNSERDAVVAEMREFVLLNPEVERLNPNARRAAVLKHIRSWFRQTFKRESPVRDTLLRYYKVAFD
jgi:hypothetical protein